MPPILSALLCLCALAIWPHSAEAQCPRGGCRAATPAAVDAIGIQYWAPDIGRSTTGVLPTGVFTGRPLLPPAMRGLGDIAVSRVAMRAPGRRLLALPGIGLGPFRWLRR